MTYKQLSWANAILEQGFLHFSLCLCLCIIEYTCTYSLKIAVGGKIQYVNTLIIFTKSHAYVFQHYRTYLTWSLELGTDDYKKKDKY